MPTDHALGWYTAACLTYAPTINRGGFVVMVDGDRWLITLAGAGGEVPPTDEAGFLDYAASLDVEEIPAAITAGTPLTPVYRFSRMANRWICYHRLGSRVPRVFEIKIAIQYRISPVWAAMFSTS